MELKKSEFDRMQTKISSAQAYSKALEQDLFEAREQISQLSDQVNFGADQNVKTVGKTNK